MDKAYNPEQHEAAILQKWLKSKAFTAPTPENSRSGESFTVPLPPPNVTGKLHLGHAAMLVIEDIMCRYHRMKGDATLWLPGTDHAAIATETVLLKKLGIKDRNKEISREEFLTEAWKWKAEAHDTIVAQIQRMGASCDWSRERFTMDLGMSNAVNTMFHDLYQAGLIYRGYRMVNWSVGAQSVLSDEEINWEEREETLYYIQCGEFVISTVRPETKCADSPVVVNPNDPRYKHLIGKEFEYETYAGKRKFFVLADEHIDPEFGTGAMTISTAHDANDFEIAQRHHLPYPRKIGFDGRMTAMAGPCAGLTVLEARKKSVEIMREKGLIVKAEPYLHRVPLCYRTNTVVEPMISQQWFLDVNKEFVHPILHQKTTLKKLTADAVRSGQVKIVPQRFEKTYFQWIDNLHDWCISRQIWWGHRIPVWYEPEVGSQKAKVESQNLVPETNLLQAESYPKSKVESSESAVNVHLVQKQQLIFARHGECIRNSERRIASCDDSPLNATGEAQAHELAQRFKTEKKIKRIITSPLLRAKNTAEIVARELGIEVEVWPELIEVDVGKFTGASVENYRDKSVFTDMELEKTGESMADLERRAQKVWAKISALSPVQGEIAFFGHGLFTAVLFAVRDGVSPEQFAAYDMRWKIENGKTREITWMLPPQGIDLHQDEDTLDTWFSSALWPFSTLGWPDVQNPDFQHFFPTSILETGHDILFFWVSRMIMFSLFATGKVPFHTVYLHGLVCDEKGQKMSKSKGNGIDPIDMITQFGTDALRMSMVVGTTPGNPINLGPKKVEAYRNFANKLWNVARFVIAQNPDQAHGEEKVSAQTLTERWLLSRVYRLAQEVTAGIEEHRYGELGQLLYEFTWSELADWGIEAGKADPSPKTFSIMLEVLQILLKLLHPYTPFVTEQLWQELGHDTLLAEASWPSVPESWKDLEAEKDFDLLREIVTRIRFLRNEKKVEPGKYIAVNFSGANLETLRKNEKLLEVLARVKPITYDRKEESGSADYVLGTEIFLPLAGLSDPEQEKARLQKELEAAEKLLQNLEVRLQNENYIKNAPPELVEETRKQHAEVLEKIEKLRGAKR